MRKSYDSFGSHTPLSLTCDFLLRDAPHFGDAIKEIMLVFYFPSSEPPRESLESLHEEHERYRAKLPKVVYRRSKGAVEIEVASDLPDDRALGPTHPLTLESFSQGIDEITHALALIKTRLKKGDAFDLAALLSHCEAAKQRVPANEADLHALFAELDAAERARRAAMSAWDMLGIDWDDFHPTARAILDEPFFWDPADDFAPNGNDTGADLLESYRGWLKQHTDPQPMQFLEHLAQDWGYADLASMDGEVRDEATIGLAFADIKLRGTCDPEARALALQSVDRQRHAAEASNDWPHREERLRALDAIERKLRQTQR
jgi:uncharacterized protein YfeS